MTCPRKIGKYENKSESELRKKEKQEIRLKWGIIGNCVQEWNLEEGKLKKINKASSSKKSKQK